MTDDEKAEAMVKAFEPLAMLADITRASLALEKCTHYAGAINAAMHRTFRVPTGQGPRSIIEIDGLRFVEVPEKFEHDPVHTGSYKTVYRLAGTEKEYTVVITPTPETHGGKSGR